MWIVWMPLKFHCFSFSIVGNGLGIKDINDFCRWSACWTKWSRWLTRTFQRYSSSTVYTMVKLHSNLNIEWLQTLLNFRRILQIHSEPVGSKLYWRQRGPLVSDSSHQILAARTWPRWGLPHLHPPPQCLKYCISFTPHQSLLSETAVHATDPHFAKVFKPKRKPCLKNILLSTPIWKRNSVLLQSKKKMQSKNNISFHIINSHSTTHDVQT